MFSGLPPEADFRTARKYTPDTSSIKPAKLFAFSRELTMAKVNLSTMDVQSPVNLRNR
jgi:hypothetical protein